MSVNDGWGWPMELQPVVPRLGEYVDLPDDRVAEAGEFAGGCLDLWNADDPEEKLGELRYGQSRDGLYWLRGGSESDHWAMRIILNGRRRRWELVRE